MSTWSPAFSPDGKSLAVVCELSVQLNLIYVQPSAGGAAREVARANGDLVGLTWTADGKNLLYSANANLWRASAQGGSAEQLVYAQDASSPAVARSGKQMAYSRGRIVDDIWSLKLAAPAKPARAAEKVVSSSQDQWGAHISPDGRLIAFNSDRSGRNQIWVCGSDGSNPVQLTDFKQGALGVPQWAPDSQRIAFDINADGSDVHTYTMRVDGGAPHRLTTGTPTDSHPSWSADGRWIYFDQWKDRLGIWKVASEGGQAIRLTNDSGVFPQESADGTRVFYISRWEGAALWSAAAAGGDEQELEGMPNLVAGWHWVPARTGIYFVDGSTKPATINLFELSTHQVRRIGNLRGGAAYWGCQLSISHDGSTLVYSDLGRMEADIMLVEGFR